MNDVWAGEAADGRVRVELDNAGRLHDLRLDPSVAYLATEELRRALIAAFTAAQTAVTGPAGPGGTPVDPERLTALLDETTDTAERRFAEISTALYDINRRAARQW
ncbi:YbaB/EbfC family nucleoid-associated protein [Actinoplanes sp. NBRC 101535]|uniref:YbaB/EbfC family nucleoid-associated protein n=1 Tax=Actinoplanes sp. NBRC 101535 TaxID=3032196 RepID=UPI0024A265D5|nr:YbaB/EbfC family nucleoid-associated protein [Actinoplanes sp. NBRC 101535]GLY08696.1 hypothetical protein Acsp01_90750 [Actinoplanes sp. NBRC 101535]